VSVLTGTSILVTGGTGSFGQAFVRHALSRGAARVAILSRDEYKQDTMRQAFGPDAERLRFFLGDIRDIERLTLACRGISIIVHAAALKQVPALEYNPLEAIRTNIYGSQNVILAALGTQVEKVLALSTDKAVNPINLYGATKLCMERLLLAANNYVGALGRPKFSFVRYGNVAGSRGSVIPLFRDKLAKGEPLPITDFRMTRFWITLPQAVQFVEDALGRMQGREVFVPHMPSVRISELAAQLSKMHSTTPESNGLALYRAVEVGLRPGEKIHEQVVGAHEQIAGLPSPYDSGANTEWLTGDALRAALGAV
jgi:UDP-N-acetylglucosamine 4,6-dehydratase/5-epimerase